MATTGQQVLVTLRKQIADGQLTAGQRLAEIPTAEALGVSRMPVRMAFRALEQEGFLIKSGRGYTVRETSSEEITGAIEVRGVLEGLAARQAVERGLDPGVIDTLRRCLQEGDQLFLHGLLSDNDFDRYHDMNCLFHDTIIKASHNPAVAAALARNDHMPFASVKALAVDASQPEREFKRFYYAHLQHHAIVDALSQGQSARVEGLMREHANATLNYVDDQQQNNANVWVRRKSPSGTTRS
ncbi:GntR family transcriptional regulator [Oceanobacter antarcticus]|jgi:GntR family transcriptional regulator of vanillate catabolism|uniref:GntR family transcriptional regulator n=1 Tax=Oceanobacter antarcticus TaxID=3133425 RepID=A0ABW8NFH3_9GAMM|tara:strand:+ start:5525 stop:6247 length:723 start_codon:yes stop_codon:yes gene_type:complete